MLLDNNIGLNKTSFINTGSTEVSLLENDLLLIHIFNNSEISLFQVKEMIDAITKLANGTPKPALVISESFSLPNHEVREFLSIKENSPFVTAEAYIINNLAQKIVGNFYLNIHKPQRPTRLFKKLDEAVAWLELFRWV